MSNLLMVGVALSLIFSQVVSADDNRADGDQLAECYGVYDALVGLGEAGKLPADEKAGFEGKRSRAEARALAQYQAEGLDADNARGQLAGRAEYMRDELRDLHEGSGIYSADDMKKMASACDPFIAP